jgi:CHAD domain-containing protein
VKPALSKNFETFVETNLQSRLGKVAANIGKAKKHPEDAERIHDLRVAIRRYTQGLRVFKDLLDGGHVRKIRRRLRRIMETCGTIRNCDIAVEVLKASGASGRLAFEHHLAKARSKAASELGKLLSGGKKKTRQWKDWLQAKPGPARTIASSARRSLRPLTKKFLEAGTAAANPGTTPVEMHQFRLMAKRLRYTLEIFGPEAGSDWKRRIAQVRELQEHLGAINDCVTTRDLIAEYGGNKPSIRPAKTALERLLNQRVEIFRKYWNEHMPVDARREWLAQIGKDARRNARRNGLRSVARIGMTAK